MPTRKKPYPNCPNCDHIPAEHMQGACSRCQCSGWVILGPHNDYGVPAGWHQWPPKR